MSLLAILTIRSAIQGLLELFYESPIPLPYTIECDANQSEPIDFVYTWVNGSDLNLTAIDDANDEAKSRRFYDFEQLKYSIRSVEQFAPWYRHIVIVTNGQVPSWLRREHARIRLVAHDEIFAQRGHLPTYNSLAIEVNLHRIPNISRRFLYFNDDIALLQPICPSDFYRDEQYHVYLKQTVNPGSQYGKKKLYLKTCSCKSILLGNNVCDRRCNSVECLWDGGDCDNKLELTVSDSKWREAYHHSVDYTNFVLDAFFNSTVPNRKWLPHMPFMIDTVVMSMIWIDFPWQMMLTSGHPTRRANDIQYEMMYTYYLLEKGRFNVSVHSSEASSDYYALTQNYFKNRYHLKRMKNRRKAFICINDIIDNHETYSVRATQYLLDAFYTAFYPVPSQYEISHVFETESLWHIK